MRYECNAGEGEGGAFAPYEMRQFGRGVVCISLVTGK